MRPAKELFELALHVHRRLENLAPIEKVCVMALINVMLQAEAQAEPRRQPSVDDEYQA